MRITVDIPRRSVALRAAYEGNVQLTDEEKTRWAPFLHATWQAIAPDCAHVITPHGRERVLDIIELCLDANRMQGFSPITPEEEGVLCGLWIKKDRETMQWLASVLSY